MDKKNYLFLCLFFALFTTAGCTNDKSAEPGALVDDPNVRNQSNISRTPLITTKQEAAGVNCPNGGASIETGIDLNANSTLDADEVVNRSFVCNGNDGIDGHSQARLISTFPESLGENCPRGGIKIVVWDDLNSNTKLEQNETANSNFLCNGLNGADGKDGTVQQNMISTVTEPAGTNCAQGGVLLLTGTDLNGNTILDQEEVKNSNYICNVVVTQSPEIVTPNPTATVNYAKLLSNPLSSSVKVGETASVNIKLAISASGYDADNPLIIKFSDNNGYFPTKLYKVVDFSTDVSLSLVSILFAEATSVSTQIQIEFCANTACDEKVYGTKTANVNIVVNPVFISAKSLTQNVATTAIVNQTNNVDVKLLVDADGYNFLNPLFVNISDGSRFFQTTTYSLNDLSGEITLTVGTQYLYKVGVFDSNLSISFCKDFTCSVKLQEVISIPVNLTVRNPIVRSMPVKTNVTLSQTILESQALEYEIVLASEETSASWWWVKFYDPTGTYFNDKIVSSTIAANDSLRTTLDIKSIDANKTEVHKFQIATKVCKDATCNSFLSPEPGITEVTLNVSYPKATLTLNEATIDVIGYDNTPTTAELNGRLQVDNIGALPVYLVATDIDGGKIVNGAARLPTQNEFTIPLELLPQVKMGSYTTDVSFKLCLEIDCRHIIGTSTSRVAVTHNVNLLAGWTTHQRNADHNGYIPVTLDKNKFAESWTWSRSKGNEPIGGINPVVTQNGKVVISYDVYFGAASVVMLDEFTGNKVWETSLGTMPALNPPAITEGKVWVATTGHENTNIHAFDFNTGSKLHSSSFGGQWPNYFAPTPYGKSIYQGGGYYGGFVHSFSTVDGLEQWNASLSGGWDMYTPAVSGNYVLHHNGAHLSAVNRASGEVAFTIDDNLSSYASHAYHGSPVVHGKYAVAYAGGASSGRAASNVEQYDERILSAFDLETKTHLWNSSNAYLTQPAVKDGVVYVGSKALGRLDALDISTGKILWSWNPTDNSETELHRNVIVTENLLFVSTNLKVHAIDLTTKLSVWSYPSPGMLAVSENKTLFIVTGARESDGKLVAIKLE